MPQPVITYLFTTFPKATETFMQREIVAMKARGVKLRIHSLWGGGGEFHGIHVEPFNKWRLLTLFWMIPYEGARRWEVLKQLLHGLRSRRAPSWLNFWENMLGAGFACLYAGQFRRKSPGHIHAAWGGAPSTAAWLLWRLDGHCYSAAAHAYDIYEHGGDWWLNEKLEYAAFIHTSTEMGRRSLIARGLPAERIHCIRRGLTQWPVFKPLRSDRTPIRLICIARLVPKKGLHHLLQICAALQAADISFEARIVGDGELRNSLEAQARDLGLFPRLSFMGHLSHARVWEELAWADVLLHTGVIAPSGDRDGLPNVIPEAMSAGALVVSSPEAATTEAVNDGETGLIAPVDDPDAWVTALSLLRSDDVLCERLRTGARAWVEENYDAHKNAARLHALFEAAVAAQ
ncbi:MAG: glycosyltransferase [Opitutaceae bacterium]|jgi:glycosyltransferase involved in cell wall biosynthesis